MSDDDVNQLMPDDGALDADVAARLRTALLDDVEVTNDERDGAVHAVLARLDAESPTSTVTELSSHRRNRGSFWLQIAAAVVFVTIGAGVFAQLQTSEDDSLELSVRDATVERSEGEFSLASDDDVSDGGLADDASDVGGMAMPEVESAEESASTSELMEYEEEMAIEEQASADVVVDAVELFPVPIDELPTFMKELVTQRMPSTPIDSVCAVSEGKLFVEVIVDGQTVSIVRDTTANAYLALNLTTCEVLATLELD